MQANQEPDEKELQKSFSGELSDDELLKIAHRRFKIADESWSEIREEAKDDLKFSVGEQWPDEIKNARDQDQRPCVTINRLPQFLHQITNDMRQNRQAMKVSPTDDVGTKETAKVIQGMLRHIEYSSNADTAYDTAGDSAARCGFGFFRLVTKYCGPISFDQDICVQRIRNRFNAMLDPSFQEPDGSDANWGFVFDEVAKDEFKNQYPEAQLSQMEEWGSVSSSSNGWMTADTTRVAEYYYKTYRSAWIVQLKNPDGDIVTMEESKVPAALLQDVIKGQRRKTLIPEIRWAKINGVEVLEKTVLPGSGKWIPIIPVLGDEIDVDGKIKLEGIVRHAKDAQRLYNYMRSAQIETIALAPKAPYVGVEGQFEGHESEWESANTRNHAYLEYKPTTLDGGQQAPPPTRSTYEPPVQAISAACQQAADEMKATTGIYDESLGNRSNAISGVAVERRNSQSQTANFHFMDNLSKSIRHAGRISVDWIPDVYDTKRAVRILHPDGTEEVVTINAIFEHNKKIVNYDMSCGNYDVTMSAGPSFETKRQEAVRSIMDLMKLIPPEMAQAAAPQLVKNMDWDGADKISDLLQKMLPPQLQDAANGQQIPPQVQQMLSQLQQQNQMLIQHLNIATDEIKTKKFDLESKERIAVMGYQTDIAIEHARLRAKGADKILDTEMENIDRHLDLLSQQQQQDNQISQTINPQGAGAQGASPSGPNVPNQGQPGGGNASPARPNVQPSTGGVPPG